MKRVLIASTILLFVFSASAVVGGPEPGEGELAITSGSSSASATTAVGPNGTAYRSNAKMEGTDSNISIGNTVENISYSGNETAFAGFIQAPTPCHVIDQETREKSDSKYRINIETVNENKSQQCVQQVVMIKYSASFQAEAPYELEVSHNNQTIEKIENGDIESSDSTENRKKGVFTGLMAWFGSLF